MNLLRVSFPVAPVKTFRHRDRNGVSSWNVNTNNVMIRGFAAAATSGNFESKPAEKKVGEALKAMTTDEKPPSLISSNAVVIKGMFGEGKMRREAEEVLEEMMSQKRLTPDSVTFTSLIHLLCHQLQINKAYDVLTEMIGNGFPPSFVTLNEVLRGFLLVGEMKKAYDMYKDLDATNDRWWVDKVNYTSLIEEALSDEVHFTSLVNAYLDEGDVLKLGQLHDDCSLPNSVICRAVFNGLVRKTRTVETNKYLLNWFYDLCYSWSYLSYHNLMMIENCNYNEFESLVVLVQGFCERGLENAYDTMLQWNYKPDGAVYNLYIVEHCRYGNLDEAYNTYVEMVHHGFASHMFSVLTLIRALSRGRTMQNELIWVIENVLRSCNLNDSEVLKVLDEVDVWKIKKGAFMNVLAEKAMDGLLLNGGKCSHAPTSA